LSGKFRPHERHVIWMCLRERLGEMSVKIQDYLHRTEKTYEALLCLNWFGLRLRRIGGRH